MTWKEKYFNKKTLKEFLWINIGVFLMASAYSIFLDPNNLVIGGVGGVATILKNVFEHVTISGIAITSSMIMMVFNIVLLVFAFLFVGKSFFIKTIYASVVYPVFAFFWELLYNKVFTPYIPDIYQIAQALTLEYGKSMAQVVTAGGYLLIIIFGAVISGYGLGIALKHGSSTGGTDILQHIFLKYFKMPFSLSLICIDGVIVASAAIYFQDLYILLYGIVFILLSGYVIDAIVFSGFNVRAVHIITDYPAKIKRVIYEQLGRGVTEVYAQGGYRLNQMTMIICIMSNREFYKVKSILNTIDPKAFIYVMRASEVHGEGFSYESESITQIVPLNEQEEHHE